jgi:hypothetical protein
MVKEQQLTVSWHVDDLKIGHMDQSTINDLLSWLTAIYGQIGEIKTTRRKIHEYLGMRLDYSTAGQVAVDMTEYVASMIEVFPANLEKPKAASPWTDKLFFVNEKAKPLGKQQSELFHTKVA